MADLKISGLPASTTPLAGTEVLPIVQSSTTKQVSVANLTASRAVAAGSLAVNGATLTEKLSVNGAVRASGAITANAPGAVLAYQGSGNSYLGAWGADVSTRGVLSIFLTQSGGAGGNVYATFSDTAFTFIGTNVVQGTAAKGINFTANTPAAGMTSQLLNWYEEGTWTPNQGAGLTVVGAFSSSGTYTRIGRLVMIRGQVIGATSIAVSAAGAISSNLPYAAAVPHAGSMFNSAVNASGVIQITSSSVVAATAIVATSNITFSASYTV